MQEPQRRVCSVHPHGEPFRQRAGDHQHRNGVNGLLFTVLHQIVAPHQQNHDDHNKSGKKDDC